MSRLLSSIRDLILKQEDVNKSIELAEVYGAILWAVDKGIYDDPEMEVLLAARCVNILSNSEHHLPARDCIHLISQPYLIGGHTRLMEQLSTMHEEKPDLLITRESDEKAIERTRKFFGECKIITPGTPLEKVKEIVECLKNYKKVVLHIHPDDMISVVACAVLKSTHATKVFFVNHADHVFTYGSSVADVYFEISVFGQQRDKKKNIIGKKSFLGIPLSGERTSKTHPLPTKSDALNFFSAASPFKFKPVKHYDLRPAIARILSEFKNATFWIVGANPYTNIWWWPLKIRYWRRFKVLSSIPYEGYLKLLERADFYVDSYPAPGGTAFAEQLLRGRRCIGLKGPIYGYSPADNLKDETVGQLIESVFHRTDDSAVVDSVLAINGYEAVKSRYQACLQSDIMSANELAGPLAWGGDITVYEQSGKIASAIPPGVVYNLIGFGKGFLPRLFCELSTSQSIKLAVKLSLLVFKKIVVRKIKMSKV